MWRLGLLLCLSLFGCAPDGASDARLPVSNVRACAAAPDAPCTPTTMGDIDPQGRLLRVRATIMAPADVRNIGEVYAVHLVGQVAAAVSWNGQPIGSNGAPAATAAQEQPGLVEARIPVPSALLRPGANDLVLLISSHHAGVRYMQPFGGFEVTPWDTAEPSLRTYSVALVALGVLGVGAAYFGALTWRRRGEPTSLLLALASLAAAGQLSAEVLRGFYNYAYPLHVWRVSAIAGFAALFGVLLTAFAATRFPQRHSRSAVIAAAVACAVLLIVTPGFDSKATACLVVGSGVGAALAWCGWRAGHPGAAPALAGMAAFPLLAMMSGHVFLDQTFYAAVIGLVLLLFAAQAVALNREERERAGAKLRAAELELQLLKRRLRQLVVHSHGGREIIDLGEVLVIRGADDYAELALAGGATKLLGETLASLAERLPDHFLRVHRSAIVNLARVTGAARKSGGGLEVLLSDGSAVAVGRSHTRAVKAAIGL